MAALLNYERILTDLVVHFGFDDPLSYINSSAGSPTTPTLGAGRTGEAVPGEETPIPDVTSGIADELLKMGGKPLQQAVSTDFQAGGVNKVMEDYMGQDMSAVPNSMDIPQ